MRRSLFNRIIMITTAAAMLVSAAGCGKKEASVEPSTTKQDSIKETGGVEPTEEETYIDHVYEGDRSWLDEDLYTDEERAAMQFTVDGKTYGYDEFLEMTNNDFSSWRDHYSSELSALPRNRYYENVPESEWSDVWKNTIYPKLQDEDEAQKVYKQISEDAIQMVAGLAQDDNGLISKGKTSGYSAYVFDDGTDVGKLCITDEDAIAADIKGIVTNVRCVDITFNPKNSSGFAVVSLVFYCTTADNLGESYDIVCTTSASFVYVESEDKWMAYNINEPEGYYTVCEEDGKLKSNIVVLAENTPINEDKFIFLDGKEDRKYDWKWSDRETELESHLQWHTKWEGSDWRPSEEDNG